MQIIKSTLLACLILLAVHAGAQSCGNDTILYTQAKATANATYTLSEASGFLAYGQYYDAPQGITVKGLCFYGYVPGNPSSPVTVTGRLYDINPLDSLPFDPPMAEGTVDIINNDPNAPLADQRHIIMFAQPVTMYGAFVVEIETAGAPAIKIYGNASGDGQFENLSMTRYNWPWVKMIDFASDNDFYIQPIVEYTLNPSMSFIDSTVCAPGTFYVSGAAPGVGFDRMYCKGAFFNNPLSSFNFIVNGTQNLNATIDTFFNVATSGPVVVSFTEQVVGWTNTCTKTISDTVDFVDPPNAYYTTYGFGQTILFYAPPAFGNQYYWDYGDGTALFTTEDTLPHAYDLEGTYNACLVVYNACGSDTACIQFQVPFTGVGLDEYTANTNFILYPNPAKGEVYINANTTLTQPLTLQIFDLGGRLLNSQTTAGMALPARFDVSSLSPGIYLTRLQSGTNSVTKKLVVVN